MAFDVGKKKKFTVIGLAVILVVGAVVGTIVTVNRQKQVQINTRKAGGMKTGLLVGAVTVFILCKHTDFRKVCEDTINRIGIGLREPRAIVRMHFNEALDLIRRAIEGSVTIKKSAKDPMASKAVDTCRELLDCSIEDLKRSFDRINILDITRIRLNIFELRVWLSGAVTHQTTCLDGFQNTTGDSGLLMTKLLDVASTLTRNSLAILDGLADILDGVPNRNNILPQPGTDTTTPTTPGTDTQTPTTPGTDTQTPTTPGTDTQTPTTPGTDTQTPTTPGTDTQTPTTPGTDTQTPTMPGTDTQTPTTPGTDTQTPTTPGTDTQTPTTPGTDTQTPTTPGTDTKTPGTDTQTPTTDTQTKQEENKETQMQQEQQQQTKTKEEQQKQEQEQKQTGQNEQQVRQEQQVREEQQQHNYSVNLKTNVTIEKQGQGGDNPEQKPMAGNRRMLDYQARNDIPAPESKPKEAKTPYPSWTDTSRRSLFNADPKTLKPNAVVAQDGSGQFKTIMEAVNTAPKKSPQPFVIKIKAGVYKEYVMVPRNTNNVVFLGDGPATTKITGNKNFVDGVGTYQTPTLAVNGDGFMAKDIMIENTAGPQKHQAVALRVSADMTIFHNCVIDAFQDTLYAHSYRQFYRQCTISGTVDFIFGDAAAVFQDCKMIVKKPMDNQQCMVTAQGRKDHHSVGGIVFDGCTISAAPDYMGTNPIPKSFLGRPWKEFSRTVIMQTFIDKNIDPAGWAPWMGDFALNTLYYAELNNKGPGADTSKRPPWKGYQKMFNQRDAQQFTPGKYLQGDTWIPGSGVPYDAGLMKV